MNSKNWNDLEGPQLSVALECLHTDFCLQVGEYLSEQLGIPCEVEVLCVSRFPERNNSDDTPGCELSFAFELADDLSELPWVLNLDNALGAQIANSLVGYRAEGTSAQDCLASPTKLTDIELDLLQSFVHRCASQLAALWNQILDTQLEARSAEVAEIEDGPALMLRLQVQWQQEDGSTTYPLSITIPEGWLVGRVPRLVSSYLQTLREASRQPSSAVSERCQQLRTKLTVNAARSSIPHRALAELQVGDVITTEHPANADVEVEMLGIGTFQAKLGTLRGKKAIEIRQSAVPMCQPTKTTSEAA